MEKTKIPRNDLQEFLMNYYGIINGDEFRSQMQHNPNKIR